MNKRENITKRIEYINNILRECERQMWEEAYHLRDNKFETITKRTLQSDIADWNNLLVDYDTQTGEVK